MTTVGITENEDCTETIACASRMSQFSSGPCIWDEYQVLAKEYNPCNLGNVSLYIILNKIIYSQYFNGFT